MFVIKKRGSKRQQINSIIAKAETPATPDLGFSVVTTLPATIPPGQIVLFNTTLYRGLIEQESSLPAGTPWPIKGYKEIILEFSDYSQATPTLNVIKNDTEAAFSVTKAQTGRYSINNSIPLPGVIMFAVSPLYNHNTVQWAQANASAASISVVYSNIAPSYFLISIRDYAGENADLSALFMTSFMITVHIYPPSAR